MGKMEKWKHLFLEGHSPCKTVQLELSMRKHRQATEQQASSALQAHEDKVSST